MNHDELLKQIDAIEYPWCMQDALRAVVALHKPTENYYGNVCWFCFNLAYEPSGLEMEFEDFAYPCPTIRAIEKELS